MEFIGFILCAIIFFFLEYFSVSLYIKINRDLFWELYHKQIIKELSKDYLGVSK